MNDEAKKASEGVFLLVLFVSSFLLGLGLGSVIRDCQHDQGRCEHANDREQVKAILDCLDRSKR